MFIYIHNIISLGLNMGVQNVILPGLYFSHYVVCCFCHLSMVSYLTADVKQTI